MTSQPNRKLSRLAAEVLTRNNRQLVGLLKADYLRPTQKLQAAELAMQFCVKEKYRNRPPEPEWEYIPWYFRQFSKFSYKKILRKHEETMRILSEIENIFSLYKDISIWNSASGSEFESLVAMVFRKSGFVVFERGGSGDGGVDLELMARGKRIVVQCKAHAKRVSPGAVRDFYGTLVDSGAQLGVFVTKTGVSQNAIDWASGKPLVFLDLDDLIEATHPIFRP